MPIDRTSPTPAPLALANEVTFELIAQEGGEVHAVAVNGNMAYVGAGPRLVALDVTNLASPQFIARSELLPDIVEAVVIAEEDKAVRAYIGAGRYAVVLESGPYGEMVVLGMAEVPGHATAVAFGQSVLYVAGEAPGVEYPNTGFVVSIDVREPIAPRVLDTISFPMGVSSLALAHGVLYAGHYGWEPSRLSVIPTDDPNSANAVSGEMGAPTTVELANELYSLLVVGDTLLAGGYLGVTAFDINQPLHPEQIWQVDSAADEPLGMVKGMAYVGDSIYAAGSQPAGDYIPFRLVIAPPATIQGEHERHASNDVMAAGGRLFVAEGGDLEMYDIGGAGEMEFKSEYRPFPASINSLVIEQTTSANKTLYLYSADLSHTERAELFSFRLPGLERLGDLAIGPAVRNPLSFILALPDNLIYLLTADGIYQVDTSNPAIPRIGVYHPFSGPLHPRGIVALNGIVYLGQEVGGGGNVPRVAAVVFGGGDASQQVGELTGLPGVDLQALAGARDTLYITTSSSSEQNWINVIDVSEEEMALLASLPLAGLPASALVTNGMLAATGVGDQLFLIDVSTPDQPAVAAVVALPGSLDMVPFVHDLAFREDLLFVTAGRQLLVIDVSSPADPRLVGQFAVPSTFPIRDTQLVLSGETVVIGNRAMGIVVLRVHHSR